MLGFPDTDPTIPTPSTTRPAVLAASAHTAGQQAPAVEQQTRFAERVHDQHTQTRTDVPNLLAELQ